MASRRLNSQPPRTIDQLAAPGGQAAIFRNGRPEKYGLYDPANEHDSCGVGFVAHIKGERSRQIVDDSLHMLDHMAHRGACGCESNTGDGAGILTALPYEFLEKVAENDLGTSLPEHGLYGVGLVFLPRDETERETCKQAVNRVIQEEGQSLLGWRDVPVDPDGADIGPSARAAEPVAEMLFVGAADGVGSEDLERKLFVIRKRVSHQLRDSDLQEALLFYICSLSTKVLIYKGMLTSQQVPLYFEDLRDPDYTSHLAMVHSRFSTNTFPSWDRAQPNRFMSHNGEINTLRGNANWMHARQGGLRSDLFGQDLTRLFPIIEPDCSDSGNYDNALEFLYHAGRSLPEAVMMM
ncbi:MAG TPA: glutamate synthase subunit alpha, partial [Planctomycetaceae bacterium]|nr:glutamate synthase subunit alpha [Planctomycetaceae bacterium]